MIFQAKLCLTILLLLLHRLRYRLQFDRVLWRLQQIIHRQLTTIHFFHRLIKIHFQIIFQLVPFRIHSIRMQRHLIFPVKLDPIPIIFHNKPIHRQITTLHRHRTIWDRSAILGINQIHTVRILV